MEELTRFFCFPVDPYKFKFRVVQTNPATQTACHCNKHLYRYNSDILANISEMGSRHR